MKLIIALTLASLVLGGLHLAAQPASDAAPLHVAQVGTELAESTTLRNKATEAQSIPLDQIGATVEKQYSGDGLSVCATEDGARLRCVFQRLEGEATSEGLWLTSTVNDTVKDRFRVAAASVERSADFHFSPNSIRQALQLRGTGTVAVDGHTVRFIRPGLIEEYSVSMDGLRQDFIFQRRPEGEGELRVELAVTGARAEPLVHGARLVLDGSARRIAYSGLRVTDATGRELSARMELIKSNGENRKQKAEILVVVQDTAATYPVRIDPTFSDANWISMGGIPGANGQVRATVVDGSGNLYIGGSFTVVGETTANHIAMWDGSRWSALGSGMNDVVATLAMSGSNLYAAGFFTSAGGVNASRIAKWNGNSWSSVGTGIGGPSSPSVLALAVSGNDLYAGGHFTVAGGNAATNIAKWNGSNWSALGTGMGGGAFGPYVYALAVSGTNLYAGGDFTSVGGVAASRIAKWNGSGWSALGSGMGRTDGHSPSVYALAISGTNLYAGGDFWTAGGTNVNYVAKWNGTSWSVLGKGMSDSVYALVASGTDVYAGGNFQTAGFAVANSIAKWDGSSWSALSSGMTTLDIGAGPVVYALTVSGSELYSGGVFGTAGGTAANYVAKWNGSSWSALGSGIGGVASPSVYSLAVSGSELFAGGNFTAAGGVAANYVAKWNGSSWSALGSGMRSTDGYTPYVSALAVSGSDLYAGGHFTQAGGIEANAIAKWNGSSWSALGSGIGGTVSALAVSGTNLYAGGDFTTAGGISANYIAKWNGSSWSALGSGMGGAPPGYSPTVYALVVSGCDLYAGGNFSMAGGISANAIANWDGSNWFALGSGMARTDGEVAYVSALAISGSDLYAGGGFTMAGGISANYIAKWNGGGLSALGSGIESTFVFPSVSALAVSGSDLYAGGEFTTAGGNAANYFAKWNGSSWSALGSGMDWFVYSLAVSGIDLYAGGRFTIAGGKVSGYVARARIGSIATSLVAADATASIEFSGVTGYQYDVQRAASLNPPVTWTTLTTSPLSPAADGFFTFIDTNAPPGMAYYRTVER